jgi:U3 small nucleolar RNA-associated protein 22
MESNSPKRRKLDHGHEGPTFESAASSSMGASGSSAFVLETDELLKEVKLDYQNAFPGLDQTLRQFKEAIESLGQYGPVPVCAPGFHRNACCSHDRLLIGIS